VHCYRTSDKDGFLIFSLLFAPTFLYTEFYDVPFFNDLGTIKIGRFCHGGFLVLPYLSTFVVGGEVHEGIVIKAFADVREAKEGKLQATLLPTNDVMIQVPSFHMALVSDFNQVWENNPGRGVHITRNETTQAISAALGVDAEEPSQAIRVVVLCFPESYVLSNVIFSPHATDANRKQTITKEIIPVLNEFEHDGYVIANFFAFVNWHLSRFVEHPTAVANDRRRAQDRDYNIETGMRNLNVHRRNPNGI
jgi:hypothetical protein